MSRPIARWLSVGRNASAFVDGSTFLRRHGRIAYEMARGELTGRYRGQWFGSAWILIHPLATTLLYLFLFGVVFAQRIGGTRELPLDYVTYILAGLIPWLTFQTAMVTAVVSVTASSALVKQFTFPIEILPVRDVLMSTVTWFVGVGSTVLYVLLVQRTASAMWLLLPLVFVVQLMAMIGVAFLLSATAVFFKDIKDVVSLFCLIAIFLMPVVYLPGWVPAMFRPLLWANPFTYMIWVYQDAIYFGRFEHPVAWVVFPLWSVLMFVGGVRLFRTTKPVFASLL